MNTFDVLKLFSLSLPLSIYLSIYLSISSSIILKFSFTNFSHKGNMSPSYNFLSLSLLCFLKYIHNMQVSIHTVIFIMHTMSITPPSSLSLSLSLSLSIYLSFYLFLLSFFLSLFLSLFSSYSESFLHRRVFLKFHFVKNWIDGVMNNNLILHIEVVVLPLPDWLAGWRWTIRSLQHSKTLPISLTKYSCYGYTMEKA